MRYLLADHEYALDREEWKFVHPCDLGVVNIAVPEYLWNIVPNPYIKLADNSEMKCVSAFSLNKLDFYIPFDNKFYTVSDKIEMRFYDRIQDMWLSAKVDARLDVRVSRNKIKGVAYHIELDSERYDFTVACDNESFRHRAKDIGGGRISKYSNDMFPFGIWHRPFQVEYKGHPIGCSYVMLLGTYAVLLSESFGFDSLVIMKGLRRGVLDIERVIHTTGTKMAKAIMLIK